MINEKKIYFKQWFTALNINYLVDKSDPATQAFIDVTKTPAMNALNTVSDISFPRSGAMALNPATCIPIELGLANPHKARILIVHDCNIFWSIVRSKPS